MADGRIQVYLPTGRFVSGSMTEKRSKNNRNQEIPPEDQRYEFGVTLSKTAPETAVFFQQLQAACHQAFVGKPQQATVGPYIDGWFTSMTGFSMKVTDGDKPAAATGKVNENTAGNYVVWFGSSFPPSCFDQAGQPVDAAAIKRGYFVDGMCGINANGNQPGDGIGIYMNPDLIRFIAQGDEIRGGPDFGAMLQNMPTPGALPPGATPIGSPPTGVTPMQPAQAPMPAPAAAPPMPPQAPAPAPAPAPATPPAPPAGGGLPGMSGAPTPTSSGGSTHPPHPGIMPGGGGLPGT